MRRYTRGTKNIIYLAFFVLFLGLAVFLLAPRFSPDGLFGRMLAGFGLGIALGSFGIGWDIPSVRTELVMRAEGAARYSEEKLLRMTSVRRALTVKMPVTILAEGLMVASLF